MDRFALVAKGVVENVLFWDRLADSWQPPPGFFAVKCADVVAPGWSFVDGMFTSPALPARPREEKTQFSAREFRGRFTLDEQLRIREASLKDAEAGLVYDAFNAADYIDLADSETVAGIDFYISKGLLVAGRKAELLAPEVIFDGAPIEQLTVEALSEEIHRSM